MRKALPAESTVVPPAAEPLTVIKWSRAVRTRIAGEHQAYHPLVKQEAPVSQPLHPAHRKGKRWNVLPASRTVTAARSLQLLRCRCPACAAPDNNNVRHVPVESHHGFPPVTQARQAGAPSVSRF